MTQPKIIRQVREHKGNGMRYVTLPTESDIEIGSYVEIVLVE